METKLFDDGEDDDAEFIWLPSQITAVIYAIDFISNLRLLTT
jgi:hypothetical protein